MTTKKAKEKRYKREERSDKSVRRVAENHKKANTKTLKKNSIIGPSRTTQCSLKERYTVGSLFFFFMKKGKKRRRKQTSPKEY